MIVQYDGEVCHCCEDVSGAFALGNVHQSTLHELWFSARHAEIVEDLQLGRRSKYGLCRSCAMPPSSPLPGNAKIEMRVRRYRPAGASPAKVEGDG
jgi:hypothetical protein